MRETESTFLTRAGLARICNLDVRSKRIEEYKPVAFLLLGNRKLPLFKLVGLSLRPQLQAVEKSANLTK